METENQPPPRSLYNPGVQMEGCDSGSRKWNVLEGSLLRGKNSIPFENFHFVTGRQNNPGFSLETHPPDDSLSFHIIPTHYGC
jgi:hypothetical protein